MSVYIKKDGSYLKFKKERRPNGQGPLADAFYWASLTKGNVNGYRRDVSFEDREQPLFEVPEGNESRFKHAHDVLKFLNHLPPKDYSLEHPVKDGWIAIDGSLYLARGYSYTDYGTHDGCIAALNELNIFLGQMYIDDEIDEWIHLSKSLSKIFGNSDSNDSFSKNHKPTSAQVETLKKIGRWAGEDRMRSSYIDESVLYKHAFPDGSPAMNEVFGKEAQVRDIIDALVVPAQGENKEQFMDLTKNIEPARDYGY